ncbi:MAG: DUF2785 domain-containing protein [Hyphomonadaceae bacterium]|nr:DUF2785 domain-containing protein [Hyphomonadaceae bacterium]
MAIGRLIAGSLALAFGACAQAPPAELPVALGGGWMLDPPGWLDAAKVACPPAGWDRDALVAAKAAGFEIADNEKRQAFAKAITDCLASPDPELRDGIAYEGLAHMLRAKQLSDETKQALLADLVARLDAPAGAGFEQPFAALALSEVARADRVEAFLSEDELIKLLVDAQHWFINVSDYRGFDEREGWRHGVAHGADLLMQLALNPRIDAEGLRLIVSAVGAQVAPEGHAYVFGESERLARPVLFAAARGAMDQAKWSEWLMVMATPPEGIASQGTAWLAWRHDAAAFLQALYVGAKLGADAGDDVLLPGLEAALKAMP